MHNLLMFYNLFLVFEIIDSYGICDYKGVLILICFEEKTMYFILGETITEETLKLIKKNKAIKKDIQSNK